MPFTPKRVGGVAYSLVMFIVVSVLSGVLIAGLFVPLAGLAGVSSKAAADELDNLPAELATPVPPTRSKVLMGNGKILAYFYDENRIYVKLDKIAPVMRQAQLAIEDHRFYEHGAARPAGHAAGAGPQLLRRGDPGWLLDHPAVREDGPDRGLPGRQAVHQRRDRARPAPRATSARSASCATRSRWRRRFTKDQILERYLNIAYYGEGAYGVEAAARHYYSTKRQGPDPGAGRDAGRAGAEPGRQQPGGQPGAADRPPRRGAQPDGRARRSSPPSSPRRPSRRSSTRRRSSRPATAAWAPSTRSSATTSTAP